MGDPTEASRDPDNNRCKPCDHVEAASSAFNERYAGQYHVDYIYIPCDGSVVTGTDDIGCAGHKNRKGQEEVANFLIPYIVRIMDWGV